MILFHPFSVLLRPLSENWKVNILMDEQIEQWIIDKLNGQLPEEEEAKLAEWLRESDNHRQEFEEMQRVHRCLLGMKEEFVPDIQAQLALVKSYPRKVLTRRTWLAYAAVVVLLLSVGIVWWKHQQAGDVFRNDEEYVQLVTPAQSHAYFVLSDGAQIAVAPNLKDTVLRKERAEIRIDADRTLHYVPQEDGVNSVQKLVVPKGGEYRLMLEDGSVVWLNSDSELSFWDGSNSQERVVCLRGEGYFKVKKDTLRPFLVKTEKLTVKVLGTEFNLSDYEDEIHAKTTLVNGAVDVLSKQGETVRLQPGQQAQTTGEQLSVQEVDVASVVSWVEGKFYFDEVCLEEIMRQVSRWYDVEYSFQQDALKEICFSGAIQKFRPLNDLLRMIEATAPVHFLIEGKHLIITDKK